MRDKPLTDIEISTTQVELNESFLLAKQRLTNLLRSEEPLENPVWEGFRKFLLTFPKEEQEDYLIVQGKYSPYELHCRSLLFAGVEFAQFWYHYDYLKSNINLIRIYKGLLEKSISLASDVDEKALLQADLYDLETRLCMVRAESYYGGPWNILRAAEGTFLNRAFQYLASQSGSEDIGGMYPLMRSIGEERDPGILTNAQQYAGDPEEVLKKGIVTVWPVSVNGKKIRVKIKLSWIFHSEEDRETPYGQRILTIEPTDEPLTKKARGRTEIRLFGHASTQQSLYIPSGEHGKTMALLNYYDENQDYTHQWVGIWRGEKPFPWLCLWDGSCT